MENVNAAAVVAFAVVVVQHCQRRGRRTWIPVEKLTTPLLLMFNVTPISPNMPLLRYALSVAVFSLFAAACNPSSPEQDARARHYIQLLAEGQHDSLLAHMPPQGRASAQSGLAQIDSLIGHQHLDSVQLINANKTQFSNGITALKLTYEAKKDSGWIVLAVATVDSAAFWYLRVDGLRGDAAPPRDRSAYGARRRTT